MNLKYTNIAIECTDLCNMRCIMCNQRNAPNSMHGDSHKSDFLSLVSFSKLISDLSNSSLEIGCINPCWAGESTLNPNFNIFMKMLFEENKKKPFFKRFNFNTNGLNFDKALSETFLNYAKHIKENNLQEYMLNITFSLDAIKKSTFEKVKGISGIHLGLILDNIHYLIEKRTSMGLVMPNLTFQFIVLEDNEYEAADFLAYWKHYLASLDLTAGIIIDTSYSREKDLIFLKTEDDIRPNHSMIAIKRKERTLRNLGLIKEGIAVTREACGSTAINQERRPCFQLWNMCIISREGFITPCCKDIFFELSLGSINEQSIEKIWLGDKLREIRLAQIKGEFDKFKICSNCMYPPGGYMSDTEIADYLKLINEHSLSSAYLR